MAPKAGFGPGGADGIALVAGRVDTGPRNHISAQSAINHGNNNPNKPAPLTRIDSKVSRYADPGAEVSTPMADEGAPIPYLIGRRMLTVTNTLWTDTPYTEQTIEQVVQYATYQPMPISYGTHGFGYQYRLQGLYDERDDTVLEETISLTTTVNFALALCLGPDVLLLNVYDENGNIIMNEVTEGETSRNLPPSVGRAFTFYGGSWTQPRDPVIAATNPNTPAYRGIAYVVYNRAVLEDGAPIASANFECLRPVNFLAYEAEHAFGPELDMNIANAICDLLMNDWGSIGLSADYIDTPSFHTAGIQLALEGNWCSLLISRKSSVKNVIAGLTAQANGCMRWNPKIGKLQFVLFREAEDVLALPLFDRSNTAEISGLAKQTWYGMPQGINFTYIDRDVRYGDATVKVGINRESENADTILSEKFDSIVTSDVMGVVIKETFKRLITPLLSGTIHTNREAELLFPGDPIRVTKANVRGMTNFPMRITSMKEAGDLFDTYSMEVTQDVFPYRKAEYDVPSSGAPVTSPVPVLPEESQIELFNAPLFFLTRARGRAVGATLNDNIGVHYLMVRTGNLFSASQYVPGAEGFEELRATVTTGNPTPKGKLVDSISTTEGYDTYTVGPLTIKDVDYPEFVVSRTSSRATAIGLIKIDNELFYYDFCYLSNPNEITLFGVVRAMIDTIPQAHSVDAQVDFFLDYTPTSTVAMTANPTDYIVKGQAGLQSSEESTYVTLAWSQRANLPACPQLGQIAMSSGAEFPRPVNPSIMAGSSPYVSWKQRSRQASKLAFPDEAGQVPGETTTYRLVLNSPGIVNAELATGVSGDNVQVVIPAGASPGAATIQIRATNANGNSLYSETVRFTIT